MPQQIKPQQRAAWLLVADNAGLTSDKTREELIEEAANLGFEAHWIVAQGQDVFGVEHEKMMAMVRGTDPCSEGELTSADSVEEAIRLVVGEALVAREQ